MCGRFYIDDETAREIEKIARKIDDKTAGRGDVHPSDLALVLKTADGKMVSQILKWGYESPQRRGVIFNARAETVRERPMFRYDYESRRCIIPARKFYEWKKPESGQKRRKEKYDFLTLEEMLIALSIGAVTNPTAAKAMSKVKELFGCEAHGSCILPVTDETVIKKLGINITTEAVFGSNNLYNL